jgi:2-oxo-4-hydroxy-4-carboxy--5-ureidoimidazoline (OHCU) decarboxylase
MPSDRLPSISTLSSLPSSDLAAILDLLFEPSVPLHTLSVNLLREQTFSSYDDLITSIGVQLMDLAESTSTSDTQWLESILGAHPRLGEKKIDSAQSKEEQAQLSSGQDKEKEKLSEMNTLYEQTFPGLRYV